ncbi:MAG: hypothetical protein QN141_01875 [Armatimonadota bacterium]|nr:hypothetical protein [Armatimonadota bacterium]MDR7450972.1 hypothetical protein [Armatimonadota bacterium]MDR7466007.1 hypothetical protein [Armatimonadota bacterium]MDR7494072.1 hypothetical protein [Armatimonadota bacterium]MDR7504061.1 hypothetical protein [Armatimonadota bacterium]
MRIAVAMVLIAAVALVAPVPSTAATKYKPCSLLTSADLEAALGAKVSRGAQEGEDTDTQGTPLQGEVLDHCAWVLRAGQADVGVVLWATRAAAPLPQLAAFWYPPKEALARQDGAAIETVRLPGAECRLFRNGKHPLLGTVQQTWCLIIGRGLALSMEVTIQSNAPVAPQRVKALLDQAARRAP